MTPLDQLDKLCAEKVMGWIVSHGYWRDHTSKVCEPIETWLPTRNIAQAWEVWEKIIKGDSWCCANIGYPLYEGWEVSLTHIHDSPHNPRILVGGCGNEESAALTIVRACLKAKGVEV